MRARRNLARSRPYAVTLALVLASAAHAACEPWHLHPCLAGSDPLSDDARRAWRTANDEAAPWGERLCAMESVSSWVHGETTQDSPSCDFELVHDLVRDILQDTPIVYDRLHIARVAALGSVNRFPEAVTARAEALIRLSDLGEDDIGEYVPAPQERGGAPSKAWFRMFILSQLADAWTQMNRDFVRDYLTQRRLRARDALERRVLFQTTSALFDESPPKDGSSELREAMERRPPLLDQMRGEIEAALQRPHAPVEHGVLLDTMALVARAAKPFGRERDAAALFARIIAAEARVPAVAGMPAARRELYVAAVLAELVSHERLEEGFTWAAWREPPAAISLRSRTYFDDGLYGHGVDCRGQGAGDMFLPRLLPALHAADAGGSALVPKDENMLVAYLPERPQASTEDPAVRRFVLAHAESFRRAANDASAWYWHDPLEPLRRALGAAATNEAETRDASRVLVPIAAEARAALANGSVGATRDIFLLARHAHALGLEVETDALATELASAAPHASRAAMAVPYAYAAAGARALLRASTWQPF